MLESCALLFALGALFPAKAQQYPSQPLRIIVAFPWEAAPM
jgi:tripartite-type tricarboxylate transporter receptor subunit TctC